MITLEKIDIVRERTGVSYKEAKEALEENNGELVESIISIEENYGKTWVNTMSIAGNEVVEKLKAIIKKGNVSRIILKKDGEVLLNIPITAGAIGIMLSPTLSLLGVSAALISKANIEIVKDDGEVVDINEMTEETVSDFKNLMKNKKHTNENKDIIIDETKDDKTKNKENQDSDS